MERSASEARHIETMKRAGIDVTPEESFHRIAFAALETRGFRPKNILELGTNRGRTSSFLSHLFAEATVYTVELPSSDPLYADLHLFRDRYVEIEASIEQLTGRPNVVVCRVNTAFLPQTELPDFDLIWLDAGHHYPEVAWDHFYCLHKLAPGGWLFTDDVAMPRRRRRGHIYDTIDYYNKRMNPKFRFLLKRESAYQYLLRPKFLGFLRKGSPDS